MPAIPALITGGAGIASSLIGKSSANAAATRSPEETAALASNTGIANRASDQSGKLFDAAMPAVGSAIKYNDTLLNGSRPAMDLATAGTRAAVGDTYTGADRAISMRTPGAGQARARAELNRGRAADIARITTGVQPNAAANLAGIGTGLIPAAGAGLNTATAANNANLTSGMANRTQANTVGSNTAGSFGRIFAQIMALSGKGGLPRAGGSPMTNTPFAVPGEDM